MTEAIIIIPCYNEEKRINIEKFVNFSNANPVSFYFVNDGSTDNTIDKIDYIISKTTNNSKLNLSQNVGKAECVRLAMLEASEKYQTDLFGYWDADLATPLGEIMQFIAICKSKNCIMIFGSRFKKIGNKIERNFLRHFLGRIIATLASSLLGLGIYDTQCGAKIFKKQYIFKLFEKPFYTKWLFDIEIFFRLKDDMKINKLYEKTLDEWIDIKGSKLSLKDFIKTPIEIVKIYFYYRFKNWI